MARSEQIALNDTIASTLGALYERKARGTTLIRVLEDYRRFQAVDRNMRHLSAVSPAAPEQELERLRMRREAVDQVIRSIEAYTQSQASF